MAIVCVWWWPWPFARTLDNYVLFTCVCVCVLHDLGTLSASSSASSKFCNCCSFNCHMPCKDHNLLWRGLVDCVVYRSKSIQGWSTLPTLCQLGISNNHFCFPEVAKTIQSASTMFTFYFSFQKSQQNVS